MSFVVLAACIYEEVFTDAPSSRISSLRARGSSDVGTTGTENIIQRARGRVALLECTRSLVRVPASGVSIVPRSRQAKELANMFVGCPNIGPVCVGNVPRRAENLVRRYGNFIQSFPISLICSDRVL